MKSNLLAKLNNQCFNRYLFSGFTNIAIISTNSFIFSFVGSESEDNSDAITPHKLQRPSKHYQYNFLVQLGM